MQTKSICICLAVAVFFAVSGLVLAASNPDFKSAVMVTSHCGLCQCHNLPMITGCQDINTTYPNFSFDAFPVFFDLTEYMGFEYGVTWPAWTYSAAWISCSDLVIGGITWPGDGVSQTWTTCHTAHWGCAVTGKLWLYADGPGMLCLTNHPLSGVVSALDCSEGLDVSTYNFCTGVYGATGEDPCSSVDNQVTTWGEVKSLFKD